MYHKPAHIYLLAEYLRILLLNTLRKSENKTIVHKEILLSGDVHICSFNRSVLTYLKYEIWYSNLPTDIILSSCRNSPWWSRASSILRLHDYTQTHQTRWDSSGGLISPTQRRLPDDKQHWQETDIHAPGRIWTGNISGKSGRSPTP